MFISGHFKKHCLIKMFPTPLVSRYFWIRLNIYFLYFTARHIYRKYLCSRYLPMLTNDAPTYISTPTPLIVSNQMDLIQDRRCQSKSPPPFPPTFGLGKLDYLYNAIGVGHSLQYAKKIRSRCDEVST